MPGGGATRGLALCQVQFGAHALIVADQPINVLFRRSGLLDGTDALTRAPDVPPSPAVRSAAGNADSRSFRTLQMLRIKAVRLNRRTKETRIHAGEAVCEHQVLCGAVHDHAFELGLSVRLV